MDCPPCRISVELQPEGESVTGHVRDGEGQQRPFSGWLGLMAAIEAAIDADRHRHELAG